jgi:hypothetical protein
MYKAPIGSIDDDLLCDCRTTRPLDGPRHARHLWMHLSGPTRTGMLQLRSLRVAMTFEDSDCVPYVAPGVERALRHVFQHAKCQTIRSSRQSTT